MPGKLPGPWWVKWLVVAVIVALSALIYFQSSASIHFDSAHDAARDALDRFNPVSIEENREYGGYIYRVGMGQYASTAPTRGDFGHMIFDPPEEVIPDQTIAVAIWHTHGAMVPGVISEIFSPQDIKLLKHFAVDGYLATPEGQFKFYELKTGEVHRLGSVAISRQSD